MSDGRHSRNFGDRLISFLRRITKPLQPGFTRYGAQYSPRPVRELENQDPIPLSEPPLPFSVVIPSYNHGRFLEKCIKSILDQNYPNLELILVDGGSTDNTPEIIKEYASRFSWWQSEKDRGQAHAINKGFRHSHGQVMCWINSDDRLLPGTLKRVDNFLKTHPEVDVVYGHRILIDEEDNEIGRWITPPHENRILSITDVIPQETLFWRRSIWEKAGGQVDETFRFAMDWDLLVRFRNANAKMAGLPYFMGMFRIHQKQKSSPEHNRVGNAESRRIRKRSLGFAPSRLSLILLTTRYHLWARILELHYKFRRRHFG